MKTPNLTKKADLDQEKFDRLKSEKPDQIKRKAKDLIEDRFPPFDQRNMANGLKPEITDHMKGGPVNKQEMNSLIQAMIDATEVLEAEVENATTLAELESVDVSEEKLKTEAGWS